MRRFLNIFAVLILFGVPRISIGGDCAPGDGRCLQEAKASAISRVALPCLTYPTSGERANCFRESALKTRSLSICSDLPRMKIDCVESLRVYAELTHRMPELRRSILPQSKEDGLSLNRTIYIDDTDIKTFAFDDPIAARFIEKLQGNLQEIIRTSCGRNFENLGEFSRCVGLIAAKRDQNDDVCKMVFTSNPDKALAPELLCEKFIGRKLCSEKHAYFFCETMASAVTALKDSGCFVNGRDETCLAQLTAVTLHDEQANLCENHDSSPECQIRRQVPREAWYACDFAENPFNCYARAAKAARSIAPCAYFDSRFRGVSYLNEPFVSNANPPLSYSREKFDGQVRTCVEGVKEHLSPSLASSTDFFSCLSKHPISGCVAEHGIKVNFPRICDWYESQFPGSTRRNDVTTCFKDMENIKEEKPLSNDIRRERLPPGQAPLNWNYIIIVAVVLNLIFFFGKKKKKIQ